MPYINIIIPRRYRIPFTSGICFYDDLEFYSGNQNDSFIFNKNILWFNQYLQTGKVDGKVFWPINYTYDDFDKYPLGFHNNFTGLNIISGYYSYNNSNNSCFWPINYFYDDFESYITGNGITLNQNITIISGYNTFLSLKTGVTY